MSFCLPKKHASEFLAALRSGKIDPDKLMDMTSAERRSFFSDIIGPENAQEVNAMFESKMLLKDQKRGLVSWAKNVAGISEPARRDFISKIEKLDKVLEPDEERAFLADLAAQKLGVTVTADEAKAISTGAKAVSDLKTEWDPATEKWSSEDARLKYGTAYVEYQDYISHLLKDANAPTFKEWIASPSKWLETAASTTKGIVASLDNSFFGRQGIKMFWTNPGIWGRAFAKSWSDIGKELRGIDAMTPIKADVFSRPNAMNGKYRNAKIAVGIDFEEAFPSQLPERIPVLGRLYKASEAAYNGAALRMRADYADKMIGLAEEFGVDMSAPGKQPEGIGALVNAMTGRGNLTMSKGQADAVNAAFFSVRFLKSNFDTLTGHRLGYGIEEGPARDFVRQQSAQNIGKIVGGIAATLFVASQLWPGSVEWDPRSSNFGKIKIGNTRFDITGGMGSLVTLASRLVPTMHNGKWGFWSKSSVTNRWNDLTSGKYGRQTALDVVESFWEGKLAPLAGVLRDVWKGETFGGQKVSVPQEVQNLLIPMGYQSFTEAMNDKHAAPLLAVFLLDALGISANTYSAKPPPKHPRQIWDLQLSEPPPPDEGFAKGGHVHAHPNPSTAQIEAGNYRKGHIVVQGLPVTIETPKGVARRGVGSDGEAWENTHDTSHYGYLKRTEGADGEHVDCYVGPHSESPKVWIVDQADPRTGRFDEHKVILGARTLAEALRIYDKGFSDKSGPSRRKHVTVTTVAGLKHWLRNGDTTRPAKEARAA